MKLHALTTVNNVILYTRKLYSVYSQFELAGNRIVQIVRISF